MNSQVALIGAPTDIGAGTRGASMGPEALRVAKLQATLESQGVTVVDTGDLRGPANPALPPIAGYRHLAQVRQWNVAFTTQCSPNCPRAGCRFCSAAITLPQHRLDQRVARHCRQTGRPLRVLWLDAHADFNTNVLTPSGNIHGMPVACLCGFGPAELTDLSGMTPAIAPEIIRQIGIRSVDQGEKRFVHEANLEVFDMRYVDEVGMRRTLEIALASMDPETHLHVSFDVDFLDPDIAPGVGTTVPGGPSYREAQLCMEMIADTGRMASLDIMELNPALDLRNRTAEVAVDLVASLFGKSTLMRR
jgi:arginase